VLKIPEQYEKMGDGCWYQCDDRTIVPIQIGGHFNPHDKGARVGFYFKDLEAVCEFLFDLEEEASFFMSDVEGMERTYFCEQNCDDCRERFAKLTGDCSRGLVLMAARCFCGKTDLVIQCLDDVPKNTLECPFCGTLLVKYG